PWPLLDGYRLRIAYTSSPRATISASSSVSAGATQNGQPSSAPGPVGLPAPWIYASRCGVHSRPKAFGTPAPDGPGSEAVTSSGGAAAPGGGLSGVGADGTVTPGRGRGPPSRSPRSRRRRGRRSSATRPGT